MLSIVNAHIVNEGRVFFGHVKVDGDIITCVSEEGRPFATEGTVIDVNGAYLLPGVIDEHVHFREPGLTEKGDFVSESRAAAVGGVTTFFDMPNTVPQTTSISTLLDKYALAKDNSVINYALYLGATNDNLTELAEVDSSLVPAFKLFMGASTGNMLVEHDDVLASIFQLAARRGIPIVAHCEDSTIIGKRAAEVRAEIGEWAGVEYHPRIRSAEACLASTRKAISFANQYGTRLMVAHVSTGEEIREITQAGNVKAEGCISYFFFNDKDYSHLGGRIKCNPAIKSEQNKQALRQALTNGNLYTVATDHAPHLLAQKHGGVFQAASGMPSIQFSLVLMLSLADIGVLSVPQVVEKMCHNPARYFGVLRRGFIRQGYKADLVIVEQSERPHTISNDEVLSKCGWTPYTGLQTNWQVRSTFCNGVEIYNRGRGITASGCAQQIVFKHGDNA